MNEQYSYQVSGISPEMGRFEFTYNGVTLVYEPMISQGKFDKIVKDGSCESTYTVEWGCSSQDFDQMAKIIHSIDILLSFLFARTVTVIKPTIMSDGPQSGFSIRPRNIYGYDELKIVTAIEQVISNFLSTIEIHPERVRLLLMLSHWLNGISCYTQEEMLLSMATIIEMSPFASNHDNFKQKLQRVARTGGFSLSPLRSQWIKNLRVNLVHYGNMLSINPITNAAPATLEHASDLLCELLNLIDAYFVLIIGVNSDIDISQPRWCKTKISSGLPTINTLL